MDGVTVLLAAAALLLLATGLAKLRSPAATTSALLVLLPVRAARRARAAALALGAGEVAVGALALALPGPLAPALVAAAYAAFALYVAAGLRTGVSCGCGGSADTPVTRLHLALDLAAAGAALLAATAHPGTLWQHGAAGVAGAALAAVAAYAGWLAVTVHPQLVAARRALREA